MISDNNDYNDYNDFIAYNDYNYYNDYNGHNHYNYYNYFNQIVTWTITSALSTVIAAEVVVSVMSLTLLRRVSAIKNRTSCTDL